MSGPGNTIDADVLVTAVVTCPHCGQKNRLQETAARGHYTCGVCHNDLPNPFKRRSTRRRLAPSLRTFAQPHVIVSAIMLLAAVVLVTVRRDGTGERRAPEATSTPAPVSPTPSSIAESYTPSPSPPPVIATPQPLPSWPPLVAVESTPQPFREPEMPLPANGEVFPGTGRGETLVERADAAAMHGFAGADRGEAIAEFKIMSSLGANYFLTLVDATTDDPVLSVFVRGGQPATIRVPLGEYRLQWASGVNWYGEDDLFGEETTISEALETLNFHQDGDMIWGHTITLYTVPNGNLRTKRIRRDEFRSRRIAPGSRRHQDKSDTTPRPVSS